MLMKLTPLVNFGNILPAVFAPIFFPQKLQGQTVKTIKFKKAARKMMVKMTS